MYDNTWQRHLRHKRLVTTELGERGSNPGHMFTYFFWYVSGSDSGFDMTVDTERLCVYIMYSVKYIYILNLFYNEINVFYEQEKHIFAQSLNPVFTCLFNF